MTSKQAILEYSEASRISPPLYLISSQNDRVWVVLRALKVRGLENMEQHR